MTTRQLNVGFVGAGQLGEPAAARLADAGWPVCCYARRPEVRDRLAMHGIRLAEAVSALAESDILIVFLFSDEQLTDVLLGAGGLLRMLRPGAVAVVHTTASLMTVQALADTAHQARVRLVDAPVSGTADDIRHGRLTVLLGGPDEAVARARPVVASYADPALHVGGVGVATTVKLINNVLFAANVQLVGEAARVAASMGADAERTLAALTFCSGASNALGHMLRGGGLDDFARGAAVYLRKDISAALDSAAAVSADLGRLAAVARGGPFDFG